MKTASTGALARGPYIICMLYTHYNAHSRIQEILINWGKECDECFAALN